MSDYSYPGAELDLFAKALRWKGYWRSHLRPFVRGRVLEVGAGNGSNTLTLGDLDWTHWVCLEPDRGLTEQLRARVPPDPRRDVVVGTLADLPETSTFDTILYIDVLEHIEDDAGELRLAVQRLDPDGHLIVLAPAHQALYSPFDRAIGHFRRYCRRTLCAAAPAGVSLVAMRYLDAAGLLASVGNRFLLRSALPTVKQIAFWDTWLAPISRRVDPILRYRLGKSIVGVWRHVS